MNRSSAGQLCEPSGKRLKASWEYNNIFYNTEM